MQQQGPPKAVTVEDSFKSCPSLQAAERVVQVLAPDLLARLQEELQARLERPCLVIYQDQLAVLSQPILRPRQVCA